MATFIVAAAVIEENGRVLLAQRNKNDHQGLKWEFPGGKIEEGEDPIHCIVREIKEELDLDIEVQDIFQVVMHRYPDRNILLLAYRCKRIHGEPSPLGCRDICWAKTSALPEFDLAEADILIAEKIRQEGGKGELLNS